MMGMVAWGWMGGKGKLRSAWVRGDFRHPRLGRSLALPVVVRYDAGSLPREDIMGLQVRLTHSLGDRVIDVEARTADRPIVVGRASTAEVQVPSANIAKSHCLLFVHE